MITLKRALNEENGKDSLERFSGFSGVGNEAKGQRRTLSRLWNSTCAYVGQHTIPHVLTMQDRICHNHPNSTSQIVRLHFNF